MSERRYVAEWINQHGEGRKISVRLNAIDLIAFNSMKIPLIFTWSLMLIDCQNSNCFEVNPAGLHHKPTAEITRNIYIFAIEQHLFFFSKSLSQKYSAWSHCNLSDQVDVTGAIDSTGGLSKIHVSGMCSVLVLIFVPFLMTET